MQMINSLKDGRRFVLENLWRFRACECFDPRDRLFSLVGFSEDTEADFSTTVDYSVSTDHTFFEFARQNLLAGRLWDVCMHAVTFSRLESQDESLPSWCPDWSRARDIDRLKAGVSIAMGSSPSEQVESPIVAERDKNFRSVLIRQPFATVSRCTGAWSEQTDSTKVVRLLVPLLPRECLSPEILLASVLCQVAKDHIGVSIVALGRIHLTCLQKTSSVDGDVVARMCRERADTCVEHHLQQVLQSLIYGCDNAPVAKYQ